MNDSGAFNAAMGLSVIWSIILYVIIIASLILCIVTLIIMEKSTEDVYKDVSGGEAIIRDLGKEE